MRLLLSSVIGPGTHLAQISQLVSPPTARSGLKDPGRVVESLTAGHTAALFFVRSTRGGAREELHGESVAGRVSLRDPKDPGNPSPEKKG